MKVTRPKYTNDRNAITAASTPNGLQAFGLLGPLDLPADEVGAESAQARHLERHHGRHDPGWNQHEQRAAEPEDQHQRSDDHRPKGEAHIAAHAEQAHAAGPARARDVVGKPRPLGMKRRHAEAAEQHAGEDQPVA
jgi:predicted small lipoprotein YifL